jgi:hypothetical protein
MNAKVTTLGVVRGVTIGRLSNGFIDGTNMCIAFGKYFWRYAEGAEYRRVVAQLAKELGVPQSALTTKVKVGDRPHTFVEPRLALACAGWLGVNALNWLSQCIQAKPTVQRPPQPEQKTADLYGTGVKFTGLSPLDLAQLGLLKDISTTLHDLMRVIAALVDASGVSASSIPAPARRTKRERRSVPRTHKDDGTPIPATFRAPPTDYRELRSYVTSLVSWVCDRYDIIGRNVYDSIYARATNLLGWAIKENYKSYKILFDGPIVLMVVEKGYGRELAALAYEMYGAGQPPQPIDDTKGVSTHIDLTPIGERAGRQYSFPRVLLARPAGRTRGRTTPQVETAAANVESFKQQASTDTPRTANQPEADNVGAQGVYVESHEAQLKTLTPTDKTVEQEAFLTAQAV